MVTEATTRYGTNGSERRENGNPCHVMARLNSNALKKALSHVVTYL